MKLDILNFAKSREAGFLFVKKLLVIFGLLSVFALGASLVLRSVYRETFTYVCALVEEKYFLRSESLLRWGEQCRQAANNLSALQSRSSLLKDIQQQLNQLYVSHLNVYTPVEDERMWKGQSTDTGIRARQVEQQFVVFDVLPESPAERAGIKVGDSIAAINDESIRSLWQIQTSRGHFVAIRQGERVEFDVEPQRLKIDFQPYLERLSDRVGYLRITSFRSEYFAAAEWEALAEQMQSYPSLIIDVRDNPGGNFVAMLRALSVFFCGRQEVGALSQPRKSLPASDGFENRTDDQYQISQLEKYGHIPLVTFPSAKCWQGRGAILVNNETSSVAEIFAESLSHVKNMTTVGSVTRGDVVLAIWYELLQLGPGYSLSIPEAVYTTADGEMLEGRGVWPEIEVDYKLADALKGQDTYISVALSLF